ncbi:uncharacterized protein LOC124467008 [Hypomesus transpacificus]|uniref:uncharacterized protein LOC124467008 n=1 Tax=Hypomesus transpacificus TaxID=137520 RepID=UPI001F083628|nr:uncharacterized protein LOC124467008 [Hypomesus transpacificus]
MSNTRQDLLERKIKYRERILKNDNNLKLSGTLFIKNLIQLWRDNQNIKLNVEEMLHGIFFLGHIHEKKILPDDFITTDENRTTLKTHFPSAFKMYSTTPPKQTPFSKLLDVAVKIGYKDETEIRTFAWTFLRKLNPPFSLKGETLDYLTMEPNVIAVCYMETQGEEPVKHYGPSLSFRKDISKNLMINWLCLEVWHEYVAYAVLSHRYGTPHSINFPETVQCQAFIRKQNIYTGEHVPKDPCRRCGDLFSLPTTGPIVSTPYGNCAETECYSKLLKSGDAINVVDSIRQDLEREGRERYHQEWTDLQTKARRDYQTGWDVIRNRWN